VGETEVEDCAEAGGEAKDEAGAETGAGARSEGGSGGKGGSVGDKASSSSSSDDEGEDREGEWDRIPYFAAGAVAAAEAKQAFVVDVDDEMDEDMTAVRALWRQCARLGKEREA
jgi:hypothetical protein